MLQDFNLLSSTSRGNENNACAELLYLLNKVGASEVVTNSTGITGLIVAKTDLSPFKVIENFRKRLLRYPYEFRYMLRIIPIEIVCRTIVEEIRNSTMRLCSKIKENETFRITVEKRFSKISTKAIIEAVALNIERKVELKKPDKIVLIEIVGELTGISVIKPNNILSVIKEKMI
jgi:tRNA acetyltransferase TAN1